MLVSARERVRARPIPLAAVAALALVAVTLPLAAVLNIWQDEAFTLHSTAHGVAYAFHEALAFEQSAPLYFVALAAWRTGGEAVWYLRLFSILCAAGAIASVPALTRRYLPHVDPRLTTFAAAFNPLPVWAALEMRPYALIMAVSAVLLLTFYDAFLVRERRVSSAAAFAVVTAIALYTQFYLGFLVFGLGVALAVYRRDALVRFLAAVSAAAIVFAPMLVVVPSQVENFRSPFPAPSFALSLASLVLPIAKFVLPARLSLKAIALIVAAAIVAILVIARPSARSPQWFLPLAVLASGGTFACVTYAAHVVVLGRHVTALYLIAVLALYATIAMLREPLRMRVLLAWTVVAAVGSASVLIGTYAPLAKPGDWIRVNAYLQTRERPHEPIVVFEAENALPFAFYYRGPNEIIAVPNAVNFHRYDVSAFIVRDSAMLARAIPRARRIWFIRTADCRADGISYGCAIVDAFIARHYRTISHAQFFRSSISLLERR